MKKLFLIPALFLSLVLFLAVRARAASPNVVISEVAMGSSVSASDEFVELYNNSADSVDISSWKLEYKSATGTSWQSKSEVVDGETVTGHGFYVFKTSDKSLSSGLAQAGGNLRLVDKSGQVIDSLAWGNGNAPEVTATDACAQSQSLTRAYDDSSQKFIDTDNNKNDFSAVDVQSPGEIRGQQMTSEDGEIVIDDNQSVSYAPLEISELLPDPASPLSDSNDEFIEIFNPTDQSVTLAGWTLRDASGHKFSFSSEVISGHGYWAVYSKQTKISLNNDGDVIELLSPDGNLVFSTPNYGNSKSGLSWGMTEDGWGWTQAPTPGVANTGLSSEQSEGSSAASKAKKAKAAAVKKASTKAKASKLAAAKAAKTAPNGLAAAAKAASSNVWTWLLIAGGLGTIGYGIYEYRPEISTYFHKLRAKFSAGPKDR